MMNGDYQGLAGLMRLKGRMGDTQLVHMSPMEVKTLDALAPGGLTTNPSTGLPEAFKLKDLLPVLGAIAMPLAAPALAAGLGAAAGGTAASLAANTALMAGVGGAAGTALAGGNKEEILGSGLTSGITAGMFGGFGGPGSAAKEAAAASVKEGVANVGTQGLTGNLGGSALRGTYQNIIPEAAKEGVRGAAIQAANQAAGQSMIKGALAGGVGAGLSSNDLMYGRPTPPAEVEMFPEITGITKTPTNVTKEDIDKYIRQGGSMPRFFNYTTTYAADGGAAGGETSSGKVPFTQSGSEDGMSDNVAYRVEGDPVVKKAMLSPDEHIISANEVAALGNGSSEAGHKRLEEFRAALREKFYGRKKQPNQINADKELNKLMR